jgi:hypothetical protein
MSTRRWLIWRRLRRLYQGFRHPGTPWWAKGLVILILLYGISPVDVVPDVVPRRASISPSPTRGAEQGRVVEPAKERHHIGDNVHRADAIEQNKDHQPLRPPGRAWVAKALIEAAQTPPDEPASGAHDSISSPRSRWI